METEEGADFMEMSQTLIDDMLTQDLVSAVKEGDEFWVLTAIAMGGRVDVTVPNSVGGSGCLVCMAANEGHGHLLPYLLEAGLSVEGRDTYRTPLMQAAYNGHMGTVEALLRHGADPLATDSEGWTALHYAAQQGHHQCVAALTSVISHTHVHPPGETPVHIASYHGHKNVVEVLAGAGWSLTAKDVYGRTPLHWAAMGGSKDMAEYLVHHDVNLQEQNLYGKTPLDVAVEYGHHAVEEWLAKNGGEVAMNEADFLLLVRIRQHFDGTTHSHMVSEIASGDASFAEFIPKYYDGHLLNAAGLTPFHVAVDRGLSPHMVEVMLKRGVSPHVITPDNLTLAELARRGGHWRVVEALGQHQCDQDNLPPEELHEKLLTVISEGDDVQQVSRYLCKGAPMEHLGGRCLSALQLAVITDRRRTVSLLLASGASLSASLLQEAWHSPDVTPKVLAALITAYCCRLRAEQRRLEEASPELRKGIDDLLNDIEGDTPWKVAWRKKSSFRHKSRLLVEAARNNCPVTAAFLQKAGGWPFICGEWGASALHAALKADHHGMAEVLIRDLGGCPYVPDADGCLPRHLMSVKERQKLDQRLFEEERAKLEDLEHRQKADREKAATRKALVVQETLFHRFVEGGDKNVPPSDGRAALLLASRKGFLQLTHLLLSVGGLSVDEVLDDTSGTTALHQAASHGQDGCVALLLMVKANPVRRDTYGQTPRLLAAMFGHTNTCDLLAQHELQDPHCRAGTTATQVRKNFNTYLQRYEKCEYKLLTPMDRHDPERVTRKLLKSISLRELQRKAQQVTVDFSKGEARDVREAVMAELDIIMKRVSSADSTYVGDMRLAGSSRDGSKLYAPDEYDVNIVIQTHDVRVKVSERDETEASLKGRLQLYVDTDNPHLQGNKLMDNLYEAVRRCLADHPLQDKRLSIVPPGLISTQVGVGLALAWQGQEYPLLLVGVDLVPVLEVPWHKQITRPALTPETTTTMQLSNAADGSWRCSFAQTEAEVLERLGPEQRLPQLMGKILLSCLKAEPWMPRDKKGFCTWFATRDWSIPVPSGFCFKNAFLRCLEKKRLQEEERQQKMEQQKKEEVAGLEDPVKEHVAEKKNPVMWLVDTFRHMCANPEAARGQLATQSSSAYFGGDCEGHKPGEGAPLIVQCLEENLDDSQSKSRINTKSNEESETEGKRVGERGTKKDAPGAGQAEERHVCLLL